MSTPRPGARVRGSATGRPVMAVLDLLGRRWTLRVLWALRDGPITFRALRDACDGASPTVVNARLRELKEVGLVESTPEGYLLTRSGRGLERSLQPLHEWSARWARQLNRR